MFAEIPAGLASVSLVLQGGRHCKPPVSRMGSKVGYALPILDAMGLRPGQGAESYLWTEADPDVRALLCAYTQPDLLRAVAEVLRGWKDEEPRALWTRLRDERRARKAALPADQAVAEWMFLHHGSYQNKGPEWGIGRPQGRGPEQDVGATFAGVRPSRDIVEDAALRLSRGPGWPPVAVTAAAPSAEEVAGWLFVVGNSWKGDGDHWKDPADPTWSACLTAREAARRCSSTPSWPPVLITSKAPPLTDPEGCVVYMDWPYRDTTPYAHSMPREEQVRLALEYAAAGALVVLSEATPYEELTALGWEAVDITCERRGQRRTFGATEEWITMSRPPVNRPATQGALFAMGGA